MMVGRHALDSQQKGDHNPKKVKKKRTDDEIRGRTRRPYGLQGDETSVGRGRYIG
jgi:hypothetical protein